jgi:hypothetical protein
LWVDGRAAAATLLSALLGAGSVIQAAPPVLPDRFTATTASITPRDVTLRIDVREWSDDAARAAVVSALASEADAAKALEELPTIGYVWQSGSAVGYAVKYAHRASTAQGERVTFVTNKRIGSYQFKPWEADKPAAVPELDYSVVELYLDDKRTGVGTLSLVAHVELDASRAVVSLAADAGAPHVLVNAKAEPKPYWATEG